MKREELLPKNWESLVSERLKEVQNEVIKELKRAKAEKKPSIDTMFENVYKEIPLSLQSQKKELLQHLEKHKDSYDLSEFHQEEKQVHG